jgi:L-ribulose-5-phosphate 3-epimerase
MPLRLGVRAHDFGRLTAPELADRIAAKGFTAVQLALNKAIAGLDLRPGDLNPGLAFAVGEAFRSRGIQIAVLGCYINPLHPDPLTRRALLSWFREHLRVARDFGCGLVALETGTPHPDYLPHPDTGSEESFRQCRASLSELVAEAERFGVTVGIEAVTVHTVSTPERMRRMLDELDSPNVQVVFDPVNLLDYGNFRDATRIVEESFRLFGERIAVVHAKDYRVGEGVLETVAPGKGEFDYGPLLGILAERKPGISILFEETGEDWADAATTHLRGALARQAR